MEGNILLMALGSVFIVSLISFAGIFSLFMKEKRISKIVLFLVSFAAGALLGDVFIHLLPEVIRETGFTLVAALATLGGILSFFILEKFICWRHCHNPTTEDHPHPLVVMNLVGDGFHNFIDGMIIAASYIVDVKVGIATTIAVILHEIPQEISDFGVLVHAGLKPKKALMMNFFSSLIAVVGAVLVLMMNGISQSFINLLTPFTIGGFIYVASSDLIPELHKETDPKKSALQLLGIIGGIAIMAAFLLFE